MILITASIDNCELKLVDLLQNGPNKKKKKIRNNQMDSNGEKM